MNNSKKIIAFVALSALTISVSIAQQIPLKSLYMQSRSTYNPAEVGTQDYLPIYLSARRQWMGVKNAPNTNSVIIHAPLGPKFGLGINVFDEKTGIADRTGGSLAMSYKLNVTKKAKLAFGVSGNFTQFALENIVTQNPYDPVISQGKLSYFIPDVAAGLNFYGDKFRVGIAGQNLIQSKKDLSQISITNSLDRVIYIDGNFKMNLVGKLDLVPSVLTRYMTNAPLSFDGNLRFMYNDVFWLGAGYRLQDAMVFEAGLTFKSFVIGYAYDYTLSDISTISDGTHEILVGYRIKMDTNPKTSAWKTRNRIYTNKKR